MLNHVSEKTVRRVASIVNVACIVIACAFWFWIIPEVSDPAVRCAYSSVIWLATMFILYVCCSILFV
jgi:hypothetical protein